jgi:hypothetical protein
MLPTSKKIRLDHDDDLFVFDLTERFHSFCQHLPDEESSRVSFDDLYQRLNTHDLHYRSSIQLNHDTIEQELGNNEDRLGQITDSIRQLKETLIERKAYHKLAKLKRRHQADYFTMLTAIDRLPTRDSLERKFQQLNQEYEQQKSELLHLNQRLAIYQKQSKVVLYSLLELIGFIDVKLPINFEDEIGRLDSNPLLEINGDK